MHHLSQFLVPSADARRRKKKTSRQPKLQRVNARKNIDYEFSEFSEFSAASTSSSDEYRVRSSGLRGTQSLDLPTSFRIDGSDVGQVEVVCRSLGFESYEDIGIPMASWEARKIRSSSDVVLPSRGEIDHDLSSIGHRRTQNGENRRVDEVRVSPAPVADFSPSRFRIDHDASAIGRGSTQNVENRRVEKVRVSNTDVEDKSDVVKKASGSNRAGNGIKGVRPPVLSTSVIPKPVIHHDAGGEWDIVRAFTSREGSSSHVNQQGIDGEEADAENVRTRLEQTTLSASCSFTTSNDDDSSSTTTDPPSRLSPNGVGSTISINGRFRHITITHWQRGELLGRGSFGSVYEGICDGGYFIAVKEVSLLDQGEQGRQSVSQLEQEIDLLSRFEHENIVRYYGTDKDESKLYIFLELVTKGSLLSLYQRYHLLDSQVSSYTRQILHGLKYLHDRGVVHRDVKCANILVDANGSVKLADFGLAKATQFNDVKSCKGTAFWMAPEVVNNKNKGYGLAADIWSLGCTVLEMLTRRIPYAPMECMAALFRIGNGIPPPVPDELSTEAKDFISECLHTNPRDRPTASRLLDHPFVKRPLP